MREESKEAAVHWGNVQDREMSRGESLIVSQEKKKKKIGRDAGKEKRRA